MMILDWAADERIWRLMADCAAAHAIGRIAATCPNARPATCRELIETMHRAPNVIGRAAAGCAATSCRSHRDGLCSCRCLCCAVVVVAALAPLSTAHAARTLNFLLRTP